MAFAEDYIPAPDHVRNARDTAVSSGAPAPSNGLTTALTFLARLMAARNVVEVGTGTGATGLALFEGMIGQGVLTSIDSAADWQLMARQAFREHGIPTQHYRLITGNPIDVLNNLRDGAYDIVLVNVDKLSYVEYIDQAQRLLRSGGLLLVNDALLGNLVADTTDDSDEPMIIREALESVAGAEDFTALLLPLGEGLRAAIKH